MAFELYRQAAQRITRLALINTNARPDTEQGLEIKRQQLQLAKLSGAQVITTVSSDQKASIAAAAGADHVVNYRTEDTAQRVMEITGGRGVDHIVEVDFAGNFGVSREVLRGNGVLAVYAAGTASQPPVPLQFKSTNINLRMVLVYDMPEAAKDAAVADITRLVQQGKLTHLLGTRFPLDATAEAHRAVEGGAIGNVTLDVADPG